MDYTGGEIVPTRLVSAPHDRSHYIRLAWSRELNLVMVVLQNITNATQVSVMLVDTISSRLCHWRAHSPLRW